jgi:MoxR-like ATPase
MKIDLGYPPTDEELAILEQFLTIDPLDLLEAVTTPERIVELQALRSAVIVSLPVREYIADLVGATRVHPKVRYGASPRGSLGLMKSAQALVLLGLLAFFSTSYAATAFAGFAMATFALMLGLRVWGRLALRRLEAVLALENDRLFTGEVLTLRADITNHKIIPVWLRMELDPRGAHPETQAR